MVRRSPPRNVRGQPPRSPSPSSASSSSDKSPSSDRRRRWEIHRGNKEQRRHRHRAGRRHSRLTPPPGYQYNSDDSQKLPRIKINVCENPFYNNINPDDTHGMKLWIEATNTVDDKNHVKVSYEGSEKVIELLSNFAS